MKDYGEVDIAVIGGGINGAGIARDAIGRGLSVLLCEKGDLGEGTSSRSGKLVHGGLRYLEHFEFRLVREALKEREVLLAVAPHIIWPMRFVLPHDVHQRPAWLVRAGLFLYDHLGGRGRRLPGCRMLHLDRELAGQAIKPEFRRAFEYSDCWVDDARLVVLNAVDAHNRGARILLHTEAVAAHRTPARWQLDMHRADGSRATVAARVLVNAAGPWVERVLHDVVHLGSQRHVRLVKGSHIVVPKFWSGPHAYLLQNTDRRVIFVIPYESELCLIGTTDIPYQGRPEDVSIDEGEIEYLLAAVGRYLREPPARSSIVHAFSGVRPLY
ncbi:MAG: glycerol-3-phosphate dehydrogenase, partial [Dehalococcoidia bacterium]|nr:glycerol-3-phosphate dehydrogenase [Dehalococcoidia bacterium]